MGAQQAPWAPVDRANALCSSPATPVLEVPLLPASPDLSLLCPQDPPGLEWAMEGGRLAWELSRLSGPQWVEQMPSATLVLEGPPWQPLLFSPGLPSMSPGQTQPGGDLWGHRTQTVGQADFPR